MAAKSSVQGPAAGWKTVAFQGELGAYGHKAVQACCPKATPRPCPTFEEAMAMVEKGRVHGAVIPIENNSMGRIADIHHLLPQSSLHVVGEYYLPVHHTLLAVRGAKMADIREVHSQLPALVQCVDTLKKLKLKPVSQADTAGSAKMVAAWGDKAKAALASELAGEVYGLQVLKKHMNDHTHNTTRFILLGPKAVMPPLTVPAKTSLLFQLRSLPAALYKALGGFATNGINLTKIESYLLEGRFAAAQFYVEAEGHVHAPAMKNALDELAFFSKEIKILGCYPRYGKK